MRWVIFLKGPSQELGRQQSKMILDRELHCLIMYMLEGGGGVTSQGQAQSPIQYPLES